MEERVKYIHSQDAYFKIAPKRSGETSLNLSNDILKFITDGTMSANSERSLKFRIFKEDMLKALASIVNALPLYVSSSKDCHKEFFSVEFFDGLLRSINSFFESEQEKDYEVNLLYRSDGRIYLNKLKVNGFSIRYFLIEDKSVLHFVKNEDVLYLRLESNHDRNEDDDAVEDYTYEYIDFPRQIIFYGAPGTGKSHGIKELLKGVPKENIFRTTFHPDSDYSTFVGAYKPTMDKVKDVPTRHYDIDDLAEILKERYIKAENKSVATDTFGLEFAEYLDGRYGKVSIKSLLEKADLPPGYNVSLRDSINLYHKYLKQKSQPDQIVYSFTPQAFTNAYVQAYKKPDENVYLIIEEINRGNCAQIFGDLFQLLDRDEEGKSDYTIKADTDLRKYLEDTLGKDSAGISGGELCLPPNLYIWATMNTSDQSLFPIDSAFKRRWDWKYIPIKYKNTDWMIDIDGVKYSWVKFQHKVNNIIYDATQSEDKMLGDYFVKAVNNVISKDMLLNKVLFYLWNDVCKDGEGDIFKYHTSEGDKNITFSELYGASGTEKLKALMECLTKDVENNGGGEINE